MSTATATRTRTRMDTNEASGQGAVAVLQPPRLPFHPLIEERFGVDKASWKALTEAIYPNAKTTDSVAMALSYCRARKLDPFKRPVHIVPMWSSAANGYVETVWPGISELRTTAFRTGQYAGCDETEFGPEIERRFKGRAKVKGEWEDKVIALHFPEWARITVYRDLNGRVCKFVGPKVKWLEAYATIGNTDLPNEMWESRSEGQLEKCAEAAALRKAFPEELGNMLTAEEMEGRRLTEGGPGAARDNATPANGKPTLAGALDELAKTPSPPSQASSGEPAPAEGEIIEGEIASDTAQPSGSAPAPSPTTPQAGAVLLLTKDQLITSIGKIATFAECDPWANQHGADIEALADGDRREVERAFNSKSGAMSRDEQKRE